MDNGRFTMLGTKTIGPDVGPDQGKRTTKAAPIRRLLDQPLSGVGCVASWVIATGLFFGMIALLGGPGEADASQSVYGTWAVAHGDLACTYSPHATATQTFFPEYVVNARTAPLWPLVSGGIAAVAKIGHAVAFPNSQALGHECGTAYSAMYAWTQAARSLLPTTGIGYASWFALLAGVIAVIRAMGRGRSVSEAAGVILVGLTPVVWMPILDDYHPEDILALGLILGGLACFRRSRWVWAGVLLGLAVTSQQFALLALVPMAVVAPSSARWKVGASSLFAWAAVSLPFVGVTSARALGPVLFGTGASGTFGGTVLWETGLRGSALTFCARVVPVLIALVLALLVRWRLKARALEPPLLLSLVATCLSLRVVFEEGLFGYKFMALAVMLVLIAIVRGRISVPLIAWLMLVALAFSPIPVEPVVNAQTWGHTAGLGFDAFCLVCGLALIGWDATRRRVRYYLVGGVLLILGAFWRFQPVLPSGHAPLPLWLWQLVLVVGGVAMAAAPIVEVLLSQRTSNETSPLVLHSFEPNVAGNASFWRPFGPGASAQTIHDVRSGFVSSRD